MKKQNTSDKLKIVKAELVFQNKEKENRTEELVIANKELVFKNEEKLKHAVELALANHELKESQEKLLHSNRLYAIISQVNQAISHTKDVQTLFNKACKIAVEQGKFKMAWIGVPDLEKRKIKLIASCGESKLDLKKFKDYNYENEGPIAKTITDGDCFVVNEIPKDRDMLWKEYAAVRGFNAAICLAIKKSGKVVAVFTIYSSEINFFNNEEIKLLRETAGDISYALDVFAKDKNLEQSEANLQAIFENTSNGFILTDLDGIIKSFNNKARDIYLLNLEKELIIGKNILDYARKSMKETYKSIIPRLLAGENIQYDLDFERKNGEIKWFSFTLNRVNNNGTTQGFSIATTDITEQRKAKQQLEESEIFNKGILASLSSHIAVIDKNGMIIAVNKAWDDFAKANGACTLERTSKGSNYFDVCKKSINAGESIALQALEGIQSVFKNENITFQLEYPCHSPSEQRWFILSVTKFGNEGCKVVISHQDITERKKAEEKLIQSEAKLKTAQSIAQVGSWEVNLVNNKHTWSDELCRIFGVECDEVIPSVEAFLSFVHPHDTALVISGMENAFATDTNSSLSFQFIKKNGELRHATAEWKFEFDQNGKPIRLDGILRDITQQTKLENETLKAYEEKNAILESIGDAFFAVDKDSIVTYWNNKAEIVMGKSREKVIGKYIWDVFNGLIDTVTYKYYQAAITENKAQHYETFSEGLNKWLEVSAYPSKNGLTGYFRDITDRKLLDIQLSTLNLNLTKHVNDLATSNKELEQFAYVASHDLQEPLRMVTSFLSQIEKKYGSIIDDKGRQYIHFAVDGAKRMRQIILDLLEFSRVGRADDSVEDVDLNELVKEILELLRRQIEEKKAVITVCELPVVKTSMTPMRQVFQNLISNSLVYQKKGELPVISIAVKDYDNYWEFAVTDNGIGIDPEYFNKIFTIFQRLHNKDEYAGTGIGLAITKKIIESMGGRIWVESEEGKGSTFYFTIAKQNN